MDPEEKVEFEVPWSDEQNTVLLRRRADLVSLLKEAQASEIFEQALIVTVALVEDYLQTILRQVFCAYPEKLNATVKGVEIKKEIPLSLAIEAPGRGQLLARIIDGHLNSLIYAKPADYFGYIQKVLSIKLRSDVTSEFIEIKATRDVVIHNNGLVNSTYLRKVGKAARAADGEEITVDSTYFDGALVSMKKNRK